MASLIFEIPVIIGAIEISRIVLLDPLAKVAFPYFKTATNETGYTKYLSAASIYYLLVNNFSLLPIYFLQIVIASFIAGSILCIFTPLWEILTTSFKFASFDLSYRNVKEVNTALTASERQLIYNNEISIKNNERKQILQLGILLSKDNNLNILKNSIKYNQNVQQSVQSDAIIVMSASVLVKLTKLLTVTPQRSKPTHYQACRRHRSRNLKYLPTYNYYNEKTTIPRRNSLLICDSESQVPIDASELHVAPPGDLFLSEKIDELDKELNDLNEHEEVTKKQNDKATVHKITKKIQDLISQIKRQKQQYQIQAQENVISKDVTKLSIPAFTIKKENSKKFAVYVIMVQRLDALTGQPKAGWIVPRRYNEFSLLNQHMKNHYLKSVEKFEFPGKTFFSSLDDSFLESRRVQLEGYLQGLLTKDVVCDDREFLKFLSKEN